MSSMTTLYCIMSFMNGIHFTFMAVHNYIILVNWYEFV